MLAVQLVNVVCILVSVVLGYLILKELKGRTEAVFFLGVCVLCPLSYVVGRVFLYGQLFHAIFNGNCVSGHPDSEGPGMLFTAGRWRIRSFLQIRITGKAASLFSLLYLAS